MCSRVVLKVLMVPTGEFGVGWGGVGQPKREKAVRPAIVVVMTSMVGIYRGVGVSVGVIIVIINIIIIIIIIIVVIVIIIIVIHLIIYHVIVFILEKIRAVRAVRARRRM
jgi:hypothetical protein